MKENKLIKTIFWCFLGYVLLTWIIPAGNYSGATFTRLATIPLGIYDVFKSLISVFGTFFVYGIIITLIGGFYGVLNQLDVYSSLIDKIVSKYRGKEHKFLLITVITFILLASFYGVILPIIALVPFFATILLLLGYSKIKTLAATIGSIIIGLVASVYGFYGAGYNSYFFSLNMNEDIFTKLLLLIIVTVIYIYFLAVNKKEIVKDNEVKTNDIPLYTKAKPTKKSICPLVVILVFMMLFVLIGTYNWQELWKISFFSDIHDKLMSVKIKNYPIIANILGNVKPFGEWYNYEFGVCLFITSLIISWVYKLPIKKYFAGFVKGAKEILPVAIIAMFVNIVFFGLLTYQTSNISFTVSNFILGGSKRFNVLRNILASLVGSLFYNDYSYLIGNLQAVLTLNDSLYYPLIGIIFAAVHYIVMLVVPTSLVLAVGLSYFDIEYKEWIKYIWKFALTLFILITLIGLMISFIL